MNLLPQLRRGAPFVFATCCLLTPLMGRAGLLLSGSANFGVFAFRPVDEEASPNFFGLGPGLALGYSYRQVIDAALYVNYLPGSVGMATVGRENASFVHYGGQLATRLDQTLILGIKAGASSYHRVKAEREKDEVGGLWVGPAGGFFLGALFKVDKRMCWQLTVEFMHAVVQETRVEEPPIRRIDIAALSLSYTFNGFVNHLTAGSLFDSIF